LTYYVLNTPFHLFIPFPKGCGIVLLDIKLIKENPESFKEASRKKGVPDVIDELLKVDLIRRKLKQEIDHLRSMRKKISETIRRATPEKREGKKEEALNIKKALESKEGDLKELEDKFHELMLYVPNIPLEGVPEGKTEEDNITIRSWGKIPEFDFEPKDHVELGELLDIIDIQGGVRISGTRNYILKNEGALLEMALCNYAMKLALDKGFTPLIVPQLVKQEAMIGTGYFPIGAEQAYMIEKDELNLIGTSEVPLVSYLKGNILREDELPLLFVGYSTCFRREAGTYGKDTRGIFRVHQFQKVEQVVFCKNDAEESLRMHEMLLANAEEFVRSLGLPYRVVTCCTGEMGLGQVFKNDIEVWMPGRGTYSETHSCSSLYDFQARRLNIRYKPASGGKPLFPYTLNSTLVASPRILIPLLECNQDEKGSVNIPDVLRPYMHGISRIKPK